MAVDDLLHWRIRQEKGVPAAVWALASGLAGIAANVLLLLFYLTAQPWQDQPDQDGWYGAANDVLVAIQYAALVPVVLGLGHLLAGDGRVRFWTRLGLAASASIVILQILLLTGTLDFGVQGPLVGACIVAILCWAGAISGAARRTRSLPGWLVRLGRLIGLATPVALGAFVLGALVAWAADIAWAWVAGGVPGFAIWCLFPVWILLVGLAPARG